MFFLREKVAPMRFETSNRLKFEIFILLLSSTIDKNSMNDNMKK